MMKELTDDEKQLIIQTIETSTYAGSLCRLVADLLDKLKEKEPSKDE